MYLHVLLLCAWLASLFDDEMRRQQIIATPYQSSPLWDSSRYFCASQQWISIVLWTLSTSFVKTADNHSPITRQSLAWPLSSQESQWKVYQSQHFTAAIFFAQQTEPPCMLAPHRTCGEDFDSTMVTCKGVQNEHRIRNGSRGRWLASFKASHRKLLLYNLSMMIWPQMW